MQIAYCSNCFKSLNAVDACTHKMSPVVWYSDAEHAAAVKAEHDRLRAMILQTPTTDERTSAMNKEYRERLDLIDEQYYALCPASLKYVRADVIAECYEGIVVNGDYSLYSRLWEISATAKNPTPLGGDGSLDDRGIATVETPEEQIGAFGDTAGEFWHVLTTAQQKQIARAAERLELLYK